MPEGDVQTFDENVSPFSQKTIIMVTATRLVLFDDSGLTGRLGIVSELPLTALSIFRSSCFRLIFIMPLFMN